MVAFQLAGEMSWQSAMGVVVLEGLAITLLVITGLRQRVIDAIPLPLKQSISVGIGCRLELADRGLCRRCATDRRTDGPYSITNGIGAGFLAYVTLRAARGRAKDVSRLLWVIALLFLVYFAIDPIERALGVH